MNNEKISISQHEFNDKDVTFAFASDTAICLSFEDVGSGGDVGGILDKNDVIALAKHFRLTADDIKDKE